MANRFDNVDLGSQSTMQRMIAAKKKERDAIIDECIMEVIDISLDAASALKRLKERGE